MKYTVISENVNKTIKIGNLLGSVLNSKILIGIDGDMSSGKTHLIKGIGKGLNIHNEIKSPTFNLVNEYSCQTLNLYHFDVYRIDSVEEMFLIGFDDYLKDNAITIIEWSSKIKDLLPQNTNYIKLKNLNETQREIQFNFSQDQESILTKFIDKINEEI